MAIIENNSVSSNDLILESSISINNLSTNIEIRSEDCEIVKIALCNAGAIEEREERLTKQELIERVKKISTPASTAVYGFFGLGDALMLTPALHGLKELLPSNPIHLYCRSRGYSVFLNNPDIDMLVAVPWPWDMLNCVRSYDRLFTPNGKINGNPEAELENAYEIFAKMLSCTPSSYQPRYFPKQDETEKARNALLQAGFVLSRDRIAVIHPESSSLLRNLPQETVIKLSSRLRACGWVPLVVSQQLPSQKHQDETRDILWTARDFDKLELRTIFAMVQFADVVIGTDSVISHLAAAYDKPSVLLYGPFLGDLRARYFSKALCLQATVECSPCFQHGSSCQIEGRIIPSCMRYFSVDSIITAVQTVTKEKYQQITTSHSLLEIKGQMEECRLCGCKELSPYARKVNVLYERCARCGSAQTSSTSVNGSFFLNKRHQYLHRKPRMEQGGVASALAELLPTVRSLLSTPREKPLTLEVGGCDGEAVPLLSRFGFTPDIFEPCADYATTLWAKGLRYWTDWKQLLSERHGTYDVIFLLHGIHFLTNIQRLGEIARLLVNDGHLVLTYIATDYISDPSRSQILNNKMPGEISLIPSVKGVQLLAERHGLSLCWRTKIKNRKSEFAVYRHTQRTDNSCCSAYCDGSFGGVVS